MSSSHALKQIKEWLPMPSGLSFTDNSFSVDLLEQFDKRRSMLNSDTISIQQQESIHSFASSIHSIPPPPPAKEEEIIRRSSSLSLNRFHDNTQQIEQPRAATIFNSWTLKKKKKFHNNRHVQEIFDEQSLSKIAINTTISISPNINNPQCNDNMIQPPIITQYPPKPLKYSPVEPLPEEAYAGSDQRNTSNRNTLKRLSLPLLKLTAATQQHTLHRRRSDSDLLNTSTTQQQHNQTFFRSLSKRWNKLLTTCKSKRIKMKRSAA